MALYLVSVRPKLKYCILRSLIGEVPEVNNKNEKAVAMQAIWGKAERVRSV